MKEYRELIDQCKSDDEKESINYMFRLITCFLKHERLREIYKGGE